MWNTITHCVIICYEITFLPPIGILTWATPASLNSSGLYHFSVLQRSTTIPRSQPKFSLHAFNKWGIPQEWVKPFCRPTGTLVWWDNIKLCHWVPKGTIFLKIDQNQLSFLFDFYLKIRERKKLEWKKVRARPLRHPRQPTHEHEHWFKEVKVSIGNKSIIQ